MKLLTKHYPRMKKNEIPIIYQDEFVLAFDKPSGLIVDKAESNENKQYTLQEYLEENRSKLGIDDDLDRCGIVHRLDKETSGIILVAKSEATHQNLQKQFSDRRVKKEYVAVVEGKVKDENFTIDAPVGRNPKNRMRFCVIAGGKPSVTKFMRVKEVFLESYTYSLLKVFPLTGRTHQIRVHLASYGHPVAGDFLYSGKKSFAKSFLIFGRMMLHSLVVEFFHPVTNEVIRLESLLPSQFKALYNSD